MRSVAALFGLALGGVAAAAHADVGAHILGKLAERAAEAALAQPDPHERGRVPLLETSRRALRAGSRYADTTEGLDTRFGTRAFTMHFAAAGIAGQAAFGYDGSLHLELRRSALGGDFRFGLRDGAADGSRLHLEFRMEF